MALVGCCGVSVADCARAEFLAPPGAETIRRKGTSGNILSSRLAGRLAGITAGGEGQGSFGETSLFFVAREASLNQFRQVPQPIRLLEKAGR